MNDASLSPLADMGLGLRVPPSSAQAEQALLGAILANGKAYERVQDFLRPEMFADPLHALIYREIATRIDAGHVADVVTLRQAFENAGTLAEVGGAAYLSQLLTAMVGIINAGDYGRVIQDAWLRRELIHVGETGVNAAWGAEPSLDGRAVLEAMETQLFALGEAAADGGTSADIVSAAEGAARSMEAHFAAREAKGGLVGVTTGYHRMDRMTGGMRGGEFWLLGARPSMGKTALGVGVSARAAAAGYKVLFVTAEMRAEAISARILAALAGLPLSAVTRGAIIEPGTNELRQLHEDETAQLMRASTTLGTLPLTWMQRGAPTVAQVRGLARRTKRRAGLDLLVIDYIGLMRASAEATRQNQNIAVSEISAGLKALAMDLNIPVLALSQLSRAVEQRDDRTPMLSDLRDSGTLEQDADLVGFLYREHYYLTRNPPQRREREKAEDFDRRQDTWVARCAETNGFGEVIIAKQRQGPTGRVRLRFDDRTTWFRDEREGEAGPAIPGLVML
jgi:replicative DNA helicase